MNSKSTNVSNNQQNNSQFAASTASDQNFMPQAQRWLETITLPSGGWFPLLTLSSCVGLLLIAVGFNGARQNQNANDILFWLGILIPYAPIAARLTTNSASRWERLLLVTVLSVALFIIKILHSPVYFTFSDEFTHWRTAADILQTGKVFQPNPLLPISSLYPGLEIVSSALVSITGLSVFAVGNLILLLGRVVLAISLFMLYERISQSARVAGLAMLIYSANPNYLFFTSQYSYESLSLPLMALTLYLASTSVNWTTFGSKLRLTVLGTLLIASVVITHHLTSYAMSAILLSWVIIGIVLRYVFKKPQVTPIRFAIIAVVLTLIWFGLIGGATTGYLAPHFSGTITEIIKLIRGEVTGRELFKSSSGYIAPLWERITGIAMPLLIMGSIPFGYFAIWRKYRFNALALTMGLVTIAYPLSLIARFTRAGAEISNRTSEFIFIPVGFVIAVGIVEVWPLVARRLVKRYDRRSWAILDSSAVVLVTLICLGGIIVGWAPWARLPGPYLVSADTRSIETQGISASRWMFNWLGAGNRLITDRVNRQLTGSYGYQFPITSYNEKLPVARVFFSPRFGQNEARIVREGLIDYMVVDYRLSTSLPSAGVYFETGEPSINSGTEPIKLPWLQKFDRVKGMSRIFDNGNIVIYDVRNLVLQP